MQIVVVLSLLAVVSCKYVIPPLQTLLEELEGPEISTRSTLEEAAFSQPSHPKLVQVEGMFNRALDQNIAFQNDIVSNYTMSPEMESYWPLFMETLQKDVEYIPAVQRKLKPYRSQVVKIDITEEEAAALREEMDQVSEFQRLLRARLNFKGFTTLDAEFTLAAFFHPTAVKILKRNMAMIKAYNPGVKIVQVNTFRHKVGMPIGDSDGVHCTFSSMPADAELCMSDSFPSQVNFHVALSPVTQGSKPFLVWETSTVQRMTPNYAYKSLLEGGYIDDSNRDLMQKALFLGTYPHFSNRTDRKLANFAANFFNVHLWSMRHRADPAQVPGQYAAIDVGEALAFDAFQKHAGVVFNITDDRYSMVFRTSGSALEGDDVVTNHPHLYKNEQDSLYMEKALGAMEEIFGYNVREKIFEDGVNGRGSADFTAISVEPRPGAVSIDGMLRHFEAAKGFFAQRPLVLSEEAVRKIVEAEAMQV